jgi:hypothetical protein
VLINKTFVTPFDREDIYRLAGALDDVLDAMEEAADRIVLYRLDTLPPGVAGRWKCCVGPPGAPRPRCRSWSIWPSPSITGST